MAGTETVSVLGGGIMGRGIARVFAAAGHPVVLRDIDDGILDRSVATLRRDMERSAKRGDLSDGELEAILGRITTTTSIPEAVGGAALVVEAVPEDIELKREVFAEISANAPEGAVLATNTSALSVTAIAAAASTPERVLGLHFFNPVHRMELVEVVIGLQTDRPVVDRAVELCRGIGKTTVEVTDRAGFATSRINAMIGNEAFYMLMEGVASAEDIDTALKLGLNHPMGPFELVDLVGLDTRLSVLRRMHASLGERFRPCPLMETYVEAGRLGRKTGHGVYRYGEDGRRITEG